jgi:urease accessory protein
MYPRTPCRTALATMPLMLAAAPAWAHHLMGGKMPSTLLEGLLSGLGHPVIGPEHLGILIAIGIVVGACGLSLLLPAVFVIAMAAGVALQASGFTFPLSATEIMVAVSTLVAGLLLARGRAISQIAWVALFAVAGVLHGYAFGASIVGAEPSPLGAYLVGLVLVQGGLTVAIALVTRRTKARMSDLMPRLAGAAVFGIGIAVLLGQIVPGA